MSADDMVERVATRAEELLRHGDPKEQTDVVAAFLDQEGWLTYAQIVRRLGRAAAFSWGSAEMDSAEREDARATIEELVETLRRTTDLLGVRYTADTAPLLERVERENRALLAKIGDTNVRG